MKTLGILIQRHWLAPFGALIGTGLGYVSGGRAIWMAIFPPGILLVLMLLDLTISKVRGEPIS